MLIVAHALAVGAVLVTSDSELHWIDNLERWIGAVHSGTQGHIIVVLIFAACFAVRRLRTG